MLLKNDHISIILHDIRFSTPIKNIIDILIGDKSSFTFFNDTQKREIIASYNQETEEISLKQGTDNCIQYSITIDDFLNNGEIIRFLKKIKKSKSHKNQDNNAAFLSWIRNRKAREEYKKLRNEYAKNLLIAEIPFDEAKKRLSLLDGYLNIFRLKSEPDYEEQIKQLRPLLSNQEIPEQFLGLRGVDEKIILELIKNFQDSRHKTYLEHQYGKGKTLEELEAASRRYNDLSEKYGSTARLDELEDLEKRELRKLTLEKKWGSDKTLAELEYFELNEERIHSLEKKYGSGKNLFELGKLEETAKRKSDLERKYGIGKSIKELEELEKEVIQEELERKKAEIAKGGSLHVPKNYVPKLVEDRTYLEDLYD